MGLILQFTRCGLEKLTKLFHRGWSKKRDHQSPASYYITIAVFTLPFFILDKAIIFPFPDAISVHGGFPLPTFIQSAEMCICSPKSDVDPIKKVRP